MAMAVVWSIIAIILSAFLLGILYEVTDTVKANTDGKIAVDTSSPVYVDISTFDLIIQSEWKYLMFFIIVGCGVYLYYDSHREGQI